MVAERLGDRVGVVDERRQPRHLLVYAGNVSGGDYEIYVLDLAASDATLTPVTSNTVDDFTPPWSPDGAKTASSAAVARKRPL